jgi:hypothetical protein
MSTNIMALTLTLLFTLSAAGNQNQPERISLQQEGSSSITILDHFDGNKIRDILLSDNRRFTFFLSNENGPAPTPSRVLTAPEDAALFDVSELDGDGIREIIFARRDGIYVLEPAKEGDANGTAAGQRIVEFESRLTPRRVEKLTFVDFIRDITGDGTEDIIIADLDRIVVFKNHGGRDFRKWCEIPYEPRAEYHASPLSETGGRRETLHIPRLLASGPEEDRRIVLFDGNLLRLLKRGDDGICTEIASRDLYKTDAKVDADRDLRMRLHSSVYFDDYDKDGRGDLVICDNSRGELRFFKAVDTVSSDGHDLCIKTAGNTFHPVFTDLNRDGLKDLILPSAGKIGLFTILKVFFTSSFDMTFMVFLNRKEPIFRMVPDDSRTLSVPLSFTTSSQGISVASVMIHSFGGDFNKDGRCDFLLREEKDRIRVYFGQEDGTFSTDANLDYRVEILQDSFAVTSRATDLNGDGIADLYLHQKSAASERWDVYITGSGN